MATTFLVVKNNAFGVLNANISDVAVSLTLNAGEGARFPSTFLFHISIDDEIISVGARPGAGDILSSLVRAQESTVAAPHTAGAAVDLRVTAKHIDDLKGAVTAIETSGALVLGTVEVDLGTTPRRTGRFTITGAGLTTGKPVLVRQANGPYTGKGTRVDEAEMDVLVASGKVLDATTIECFWATSYQGPIKGNVKFDYEVSL